MRLRDILVKQAVSGELKSTDKEGILVEMAYLTEKAYPKLQSNNILKVLQEREKLGSTGVGCGVAIPHGKISGLDSVVAAFGRSKNGIDFNSHDKKLSQLFFVILAPENVVGVHLQALARLSRLLKGEATRQKLLEARNDTLFDVLISEDDAL